MHAARAPISSACSNSAAFSGSDASTARTPASIFSHTRGTAKNTSGRTCGRYDATAPASGQVVTS